MKYFVSRGDVEYEVTIQDADGGGFEVEVDGRRTRADLVRVPGEELWSLLLDGKSFDLLVTGKDGRTAVIHHGLAAEVLVESARERNARLLTAELPSVGGGRLVAVMPGIVVAVHVQAGAKVQKGDPLVVLEAMKMENEMRTAVSGVVAKVNVTKGQTVNAGDVLVEIDAE